MLERVLEGELYAASLLLPKSQPTPYNLSIFMTTMGKNQQYVLTKNRNS